MTLPAFPDAHCVELVRKLTAGERDTLILLSKGLTYQETGRMLGKSIGTVQDRVKSLYRKLDISTSPEAAVIAAKAGIV